MPNLQAAIFSRRFRGAANKFQKFPDSGHVLISHSGKDATGKTCEIVTGVRTAQKLQEVCGIWLIEARKQNLIPDDQHELIRLVDEHSTPFPCGETLPTGTLMRMERCPYNLFLALCAGGTVEGRIVEQNGRAELVPIGEKRYGRAWQNPGRFVTCIDGKPVEVITDRRKRYREVGGLMESVAPGAVEHRPMDRNAELCEWLADLLETESPASVGDKGKTPQAGARGVTPTTNVKQDVHAALIDKAKLSASEAKVFRVIVECGGKLSLADAEFRCECDAVSAFKRAKRKLKKCGWNLRRQHGHLCADPLPAKGQK